MPTPLNFAHRFDATPERVFALFTDPGFLEGRLADTGGLDPQVVGVDTADGVTTVVTRQSIPSSALPSMVASMINGDPVTERTETWRADGGGHTADFSVVIKGAPASLKGTMKLTAADGGTDWVVDANATVPIPLFGGKIESIITEQVGTLLTGEAAYTATTLAS